MPDRARILGLLDGGANVTDTAARFGVDRRTIQTLQYIFTETGSTDGLAVKVRTSHVTLQRQNR